jgi:hypothetical protein
LRGAGMAAGNICPAIVWQGGQLSRAITELTRRAAPA